MYIQKRRKHHTRFFCFLLDRQDLAGAEKAAEAEAKAIEEVRSCVEFRFFVSFVVLLIIFLFRPRPQRRKLRRMLLLKPTRLKRLLPPKRKRKRLPPIWQRSLLQQPCQLRQLLHQQRLQALLPRKKSVQRQWHC